MNIPNYIQTENQEPYHEQMNQYLRANISENGWTVAALSAANISQVQDSAPVGTIWFNTDIAKLVVKTAGSINPPAATVIETITSA